MSSTGENAAAYSRQGALAAAVRDVKNAAADREDVVVEMREAERMRLELFVAELSPVIADVPREIDMFDFAISNGLQPRFWIDATSHVSMGRDKRTFRFLRDTRLGRIVVAESTSMKSVTDQVTRYIAERLVERQRLLDGDIVPARQSSAGGHERSLYLDPATSGAPPTETSSNSVIADDTHINFGWQPFLSGLGVALLGAIFAAGITASYYWDRLDFSRLGLDRLGF